MDTHHREFDEGVGGIGESWNKTMAIVDTSDNTTFGLARDDLRVNCLSCLT